MKDKIITNTLTVWSHIIETAFFSRLTGSVWDFRLALMSVLDKKDDKDYFRRWASWSSEVKQYYENYSKKTKPVGITVKSMKSNWKREWQGICYSKWVQERVHTC